MIKEVQVPEISENVESGEVLNILVKQGDRVSAEQALVELETEKAAFEVPSPMAGQVAEILIKQGDKVSVGQVILKIETEPKEQPKEEKPARQKQPETEKKEQPEPKEPTHAPSAEKKPGPKESQRQPAQAEEPETAESSRTAPAAPSVRQLARELGINIGQVRGTGPAGRISTEDVKEYAKRLIEQCASGPATLPARQAKPLPDFSKWGPIDRQAAGATRRKIAETMTEAWAQVAHVTQHDNADITLLMEFIAQCSEQIKQSGGKLTVTAVLLKVVANALQLFPKLNTSFDPDAEEIIYKKYIHLAVAVDTDRGLLVPVIRDADKKSLAQLSQELGELAEKARSHKVTPDEMLGSTFTVTNLGGIGGSFFTPIVYWPQVAILGISRAVRRPLYTEQGLQPRWMLPLSLSYDHRIVDGAEGLRFLRAIVEQLEKPFQLALSET